METTGVELIAQERRRQIEKEGWSADHDSEHKDQSLAIAASIYAMPKSERRMKSVPNVLTERGFIEVPKKWPWHIEWWKPTPTNRIKELTKAGALIAAEIDRLLKEREKQ